MARNGRDELITKRFVAARHEALNTTAWDEWTRSIVTAHKYMQGKSFLNKSKDDAYHPVITAPVVAELVDQIASFISFGRFRSHVTARNPVGQMLTDVMKDLLEAWQDMTNVEGYVHEATRDMVACGAGAIKGYVDESRLIQTGNELGVERLLPGTWWVNPLARDPYNPTLGSDYFCHERATRKRDLMRRYPQQAQRIEGLGSTRTGQLDTISDEQDPLHYAYQALTSSDTPSETEDVTKYSDESNTWVREADFYWRELVPTELPELGLQRVALERWSRAVLVMPGNIASTDPTQPLYLEFQPVRYRRPPISILTQWMRNDSPYPVGVMARVGDLPDLLDNALSLVMHMAQLAAKYSGIIAVRTEHVDPETLDELESGDPSGVLKFGTRLTQPHMTIDQMMTQLKVSMPNFGEFDALINRIDGLIQQTSGVSAVASGRVGQSQRIAARGIEMLQNRSFASQTTSRLHVDSAATHIFNMGIDMIQHHWITPFTASEMGAKSNMVVNRMILPEQAGMLRGLLTSDVPTIDGELAVPNSVRVVDRSGEERAQAVDFRDEQEALRILHELDDNPEVTYWEIGINDISAVDFNVKVEIDTEHEQRKQEMLQYMTLITQMFPGEKVFAKRIVWDVLMDGHPEMDWDRNIEEMGLDEIVDMARSLPDEQRPQLAAMFQQFLAQLQQQQTQAQPQQLGAGTAPPQIAVGTP